MLQEGSVRERKRRETLRRITDVGISLFIENGYDATTLDQIAAAAGISRRTFFHYFKSKDDILLSLQSGMRGMIAEAVRNAPENERPLDAVRNAVLTAVGTVSPDDMIVLDRIMRSSEAVQARKQASYVEHEKTLLEAMRERWPAPEQDTALRLVAMLAIGTIRLSTDTLNKEEGKRPMIEVLREAFDALKQEVESTRSNHGRRS